MNDRPILRGVEILAWPLLYLNSEDDQNLRIAEKFFL